MNSKIGMGRDFTNYIEKVLWGWYFIGMKKRYGMTAGNLFVMEGDIAYGTCLTEKILQVLFRLKDFFLL